MSTIYLYIKQHSITKLLYFGKTKQKNFEKYSGSGTYWKNHIKQHGKYIDTLCIWEFDNIKECINFALRFSKENNIVNSDKWANLTEENGIDGALFGIKRGPFSEEHKAKMKKPKSDEHKRKIAIARSKQLFTEETRKRMSKAQSKENNPMYDRIWINNSIIHKAISKKNVDNYLHLGFCFGMLKRKNR